METKPGYKTTEFWVGLVLPQVLSLAVLFGVFTPEQSSTLTHAISQIVAGVVSGASAFGYNIARGQAKKGIKPDETS